MITPLNSKFIDSSINNFCINTCQDFVYESINISKNEFSDINNAISVNTQNITDHINETIKDEIFRRFAWVGINNTLSSHLMLELISNGIIPSPTLNQIQLALGLTEDDMLKNLESLKEET